MKIYYKQKIFFYVLVLFNTILTGQQFTEMAIPLSGVYKGSVAWGDYDNDGDLDIVLIGYSSEGYISKIYRNDGNDTFTEQTSISLTGVWYGSVAWGDYDNDGDLDILLCGDTQSQSSDRRISKIYRNEGNNTFQEQTGISLIGISDCSVAWGDYDNDGELDILMSGDTGSNYISKIYRNNGDNTFDDQTGISLPGAWGGSSVWGDYDKDGDLDILLCGNPVGSKIFRNNGDNTFSEQSSILLNHSVGPAAWGDYDSDGFLDILLTSTTVIYHNNGDNTFTKLDSISLPNVSGPSCWGDYDNDGDLDIVLIGYSSGSYISKIYRNDGNNSFTEMTSEDLIGVHRGSIALGDYDNDGDLDIILTGDTGISTIGSISKIYRNNIQIPNTLPTVPANLTSTIIGYDVILNWSKSTDLQTLQPGLGYNLVIGTSPGAVDVLSPMSDRNTGYRRISNLGNTNNRNSWLMKSLIRGQTYYWSVQALDNCFAGSAFAQEKSFTIPSIEIISPIGGENWMVGTVQKIKWTSSGVDYIRIKYSTDNGTSWGNITNQTQSGYGSLNWTVLNTPSSNCKVKITAVSDSIVNSISENVFTIFTYPSPLALNYNYSFGDATKMSSYQIIGLPGANDLPFANLMTGSPGKENDWRAFWDIGSGDYLEYNGSDIFNITPGKAFWVISKNLISINQTVNAVPLSADNSYSIDVHSEWNLISNPFNKSIAWSSIQIANNVTQSIHFYQTGSYTNSANFEPYKGYYFYNANGLDSLKIPYLTTNPLPKNNSVSIKELEIMLRDNAVQKAMISIGVSEDAKQGLDLLDIFSPPSQFCEISMSLFNNELETNYKYLQNDYRPGITDGQEYNIVIKNTSDETLKLVTNGEENFSEYEIYLLDKRLMKLYNLRDQNKITIKKNTPGKEYSLFIGTEEYILQKKSRLLPIEYLLYQNYPNPFNPNTTILFALPQQSNVSLKIFNILGELMVELVNDQLYEEGYHEIMFDGSLLSSGVYIYRIQAGEFSDIKKMLLLK